MTEILLSIITIIFFAAILFAVFYLAKCAKKMKEGERRYRTFVEGANDGIVIVEKGVIKYVNPAILNLTGHSKEDMLERGIFSFFSADDRGNFYRYYSKRKKHSNSIFYEGKIVGKNGAEIDIEMSMGVVEHKGFSEEMIIFRDVRKKKKLEEIFSHQEERFRALTENTPDIIARFDKECRYLYVNPAAEREFGISKKEFFWKKEGDLDLPGNKFIATAEAVTSVFKTKKTTTFYSEVEFKSSIKHYHTTLIPETTKDGSVRSVLSVSRDITEVRDLDKIKSEFISLASHQLKSPLSIVRWSSISLLEESNLQGEDREALENIYNATKEMINLSDAFVNVTALDLGLFVFNPREMDFVELTKTIVKEHKNIIENKKINLKENYPSISPVIIDPHTAKTILRTLLSNAFDYTHEGGEVSISLKKEGESMVIRVDDNGCGIKKEDQEKIFERFYRTEEAKKIKGYGTGLNMYITKSILKKKGGSISVESPNEQGGTSVEVSFPVE